MAATDMTWVQRWGRLGRALLGGVLLVVLSGVGASVALSKSRPSTGLRGEPAETFADRIRGAVAMDAWADTGAVRFTFAGRNTHLWDRRRKLSRVQWGNVTVLQRLDQRVGRAFRGDREVHGKERARLVQKAWEAHINDTFWLQPFANIANDDVKTSIVELGGVRGLLVEYGSGGVTPGDAYWWEVDAATGRPVAWRMWVQVIPIGGVRASWEGWTELPTGAWVATDHALGPIRLKLTDVAGARTLEELEGADDPFDPLVNW